MAEEEKNKRTGESLSISEIEKSEVTIAGNSPIIHLYIDYWFSFCTQERLKNQELSLRRNCLKFYIHLKKNIKSQEEVVDTLKAR